MAATEDREDQRVLENAAVYEQLNPDKARLRGQPRTVAEFLR